MNKLILTFIFMVLAWSSIQAQEKTSTSVPGHAAELERLSREWTDATLRHDMVKLEELMAPEYVLRFWDGYVPDVVRSVWLDNLLNHIKVDRWEQKSISAHIYGNTGIVTSKYIWAGTKFDKPFDSMGFITDVWVRRHKHWKVVSRTSGAIPGSTINGKKIVDF